MKEARLATFLALSGFFLFCDRIFKSLALKNSAPELINKYLGWQPHINPGVAFGIPLPLFLIIAFSVPTIAAILYFTVRQKSWGMLLVVFGALSNFFDRIVYGSIVDYILIGASLINIADMMIVGGLIIFLLFLQTKRR